MESTESSVETTESAINWSTDAPRGGRTVLNRILKENAAVPLFFAQTFISSLRDVGYNHTTSALCEHVDNAIEAGATEIRVYFRQTGKKGDYQIDTAVYDNGRGMEPNVLKVATSFGGSMNYNNRGGIGRFGMGMKTAALSMSPVMELYSWQEQGAIYGMILDVDAIGRDRSNAVNLPDPILSAELRGELSELFTKPMAWPADQKEQEFFADDADDLVARLGDHGTIVYMPGCDRLSSRKSRTLGEHAVSEMARVYRRAISSGLNLYINNRRVEAFDPTYSMPSARHVRMLPIGISSSSRLVFSRTVHIPVSEHDPSNKADVVVKVFRLPNLATKERKAEMSLRCSRIKLACRAAFASTVMRSVATFSARDSLATFLATAALATFSSAFARMRAFRSRVQPSTFAFFWMAVWLTPYFLPMSRSDITPARCSRSIASQSKSRLGISEVQFAPVRNALDVLDHQPAHGPSDISNPSGLCMGRNLFKDSQKSKVVPRGGRQGVGLDRRDSGLEMVDKGTVSFWHRQSGNEVHQNPEAQQEHLGLQLVGLLMNIRAHFPHTYHRDCS